MKYLKYLAVLILIIAVVAGLAYFGRHDIARMQEGLPGFTHGESERLEFRVAMADGTKLYTTVQMPSGEGPFPAILVRNPYAQFGTIMRDTLCGRFARYGYACVFQDVRGQGESEGEWVPALNELKDGRDTLKWLVDQPFQDGNIGMVGPSYLAAVQWAAAASGLPPEVKTMVPAVFPTDNRNVLFSDGMFRHETFTAWASMMRSSNSQSDDAGADYQRAIRHYPHNEVDTEIFGVEMPWYQEMINIEDNLQSYDENVDNQAIFKVPENLEIPILMVGGWYDVFFGPQFDDWQRLATKSSSRFIIGPWTHIGGSGEAFEIENAGGGLFQWKEMLPWMEHHLKGKPMTLEPGLSVYTMGENQWSHYEAWPGDTQTINYAFDNLAESNNCTGGTLSTAAGSGEISYVYDPMNPVPTRGGAGMLAFILPGFDGAKPANVLQDGFCERDDVLSFSTDTLDDAVHIAGVIEVELNIASTAPDTAFTAKLIEEFSDGRLINIRDGITSLAFDKGRPVSSTYVPGSRTTTTIRLWPIDWKTTPGSKLRLDISSSDFPKFHAHRNKRGAWADHDSADIATQTIYGGALSLPIR